MAQGEVPGPAEFLARALPWPVEGGPKFYTNVHYRRPFMDNGKVVLDKKGKPRMIYPGRACTSVKEAANVVDWVNTFDNYTGTDTYVCMSGQAEAKEKINQRGRTYYTAVRAAQNALLLKSFYVDVDVKPDEPAKGYATPMEAVKEFTRIRKAIGLPTPSLVVWSGSGGFHAHWCLVEPIEVGVWLPVAHALVAALNKYGFRGDTGCTIDAARLLRVPGTRNHKQAEAGVRNPVRLVSNPNDYILEAITKPLQEFIDAAPQRVSTFTPIIVGAPSPRLALSNVEPDTLATGITTSTGLVAIAEVAKACPWVAHTLATEGVDNDNPLWLASINVALFTHEGNDAAHWMSQGHPEYSRVATDELWLRQQQTKQLKNMGWPSCRSIAANGAAHCKTCPHLQQGKSPFNFLPPIQHLNGSHGAASISTLATSTPIQVPLPPGYSYGPTGIVNMTLTDPDTGNQTQEPVCQFELLKPWMQDHPASFNFTTYTAGQIGVDAFERQVKFPLEMVHDKSALAKELATQHMVIHPNAIPRFTTFMVSWIEQLRRDRDNVVQSAPFGWYRHNGRIAGFIYAKQIWSTGVPRPASNPDPVLERQYTPTGELQPWLDAAKMITDQERPELNAILASAFGAPLVALVGQTGLLMSTYSPESGIGKSTTLRITQATWGHPKKAIQSLSDTLNSVVKKIGDIKNLPMYWDELKTKLDTQKFVALAFQLAQGKEKSRMASDTTYRDPGTWETLLVSTSNDSLLSDITASTRTTSAGVARVFEFVIPPGVKGQISPATAQQIAAKVDNNYGMAGLKYAQFLGANYERVAVEVDDKLHEIEELYSVTSEERFWLALVTVITMGAKYANEIGLTQIDEGQLWNFLIDKFQNMRLEKAASPVDIGQPETMLGLLARFLNEKRAHNTIITNFIFSGRGRPPQPGMPGAITMRTDPLARLDEVQVQFGTDDKKCRIVRASLLAWLDEEQMSKKIILQKLAQQYKVSDIRARLGVGTPRATQAEQVLEFDYSDPIFRGHIDV